ncbi:hypothetical protein HYT17_03510 [Candidatus Microgenomates bacterium]|nr:hypothetical protein [Candidatus Microgenomates bacterium]
MENEINPPAVSSQEEVSQTAKPKSKLFLAGLVIALVIIVLAFLWLASNNYQQKASQTIPPARVSPEAPSPTPATLDEELNSITIEETDRDFADIDSDLQNL